MPAKKKKNLVPIVAFALAGMILLLAILQVSLYIPAQLQMLDDATLQGATEEQIAEYFWQQLMPQVLSYIIPALGFIGVLSVAGMRYLKHDDASKIAVSGSQSRQIRPNAPEPDADLDDFLEDFEIIKDKQQSE